MTPEKWSLEWRAQKLKELYDQWKDCERCSLSKSRDNVVFGEGNPDADIVWVSEAPGDNENKTGRPFVGNAGELLDSFLEHTGFDRGELFITNIVGCRPPNNRDPVREERDACISRVHEILYVIDPYIIVACGKVALETLARGRWSIKEMHGQLFSSPYPEAKMQGEMNGAEIPGRFFPRKGGKNLAYSLDYDLVPIFHPSFVSRFDSYDEKKGTFQPGGLAHRTLDDLRALKDRVEKIKSEYRQTQRLFERS